MNIISKENKKFGNAIFMALKRDFEMIFCPEDNVEFYITKVIDYHVKNIKSQIGDYKFTTRELKEDISTSSNYKLQVIEANDGKYGERFGMLLMRFLNADFSNFYTAYNTFFFAYGLLGYSPEDAKYFMENDEWNFDSEEGFIRFAEKWYSKVKNEMQDYQAHFRQCVDYVYNLNGDNRDTGISYVSKLRSFTLQDKEISSIQNQYNISLKNTIENPNDIEISNNLSKVAKLVENKKININTTLTYEENYNCYSLCYRILELIATINTMPIKTCQNDGKYFIPTHRVDEIYCDYKHLDGSTCRDIGAKKKYAQKAQQDPALSAYNKIYQTKIMRTRRNPENKELKEQFENFKLRGTAIKKAYLENKLNLDEYNKLLKVIENDETNSKIEKFI